MPLQNESYGEHTHKKHGIDIDSLLQQEVIDNEKCFWNIAQCQTDSLNYFYHREEKRIASKIIRSHKTITSQDLVPLEGSLDASDRDSQKIRLLALEDLENLMLQIQDLMAFLDTSRDKFSHIVTKFDEHHGSDTASEEMETFELTYQFMNNGRLQSLKEYGERLVESCTAKIFDANKLQVPQFFRTSFYGYSGSKRASKKSILSASKEKNKLSEWLFTFRKGSKENFDDVTLRKNPTANKKCLPTPQLDDAKRASIVQSFRKSTRTTVVPKIWKRSGRRRSSAGTEAIESIKSMFAKCA